MKIKLVTMGETHQPFVKEGLIEFEKRVKKYVSWERIENPQVKGGQHLPVRELKRKEGELLLKRVEKTDWLVLLDEKGKTFTSEQFANEMQKLMNRGTKTCCFMIGGAYGFDESVYQRANQKVALSEMTFSHQLVRLIFAEQLYRAFTIIKGEKYHH